MKIRGNKILHVGDRYLGIPIIYILGFFHRRKSLPKTINKIGVILLGAIGDSLLVSPTLVDMQNKYNKAQITIFVTKNNFDVFSLFNHTYNVQVISLSKPFAVIRSIRKYKFDVLIDYSQWLRISAIYAYFAKAKFTLGFQKQGQLRHYVYDGFVKHSNLIHEIDNYRNLVMSLDVVSKMQPEIVVGNAAKAKITKLKLGKYVVLHPWSSGYRCELKRWSQNRWIELARFFVKNGYRVVVTGSRADIALTAKLLSVANLPIDEVISMAGKLTLMETSALLNKAKIIVTVNTGIMHLGAALDVPMVALHGPTNPARWGPLSDKAIVVVPEQGSYGYLDLGFEYPRFGKAVKCMQNIAIAQVINAVKKQI